MKNHPLRIVLTVLQTTLIYSVLEQDNTWYGVDFKASNGVYVKSNMRPELDDTASRIFLRGSDNKDDNKICTIRFDSVILALEYKERILVALAEAAESLKKSPVSSPAPSSSVNIFEEYEFGTSKKKK